MEMYVKGDEKMKPINLEPRYSTQEIPGKCIKCLAEQELGSCLMTLLRESEENKDLETRFDALVSFLRSPESKKLRDEAFQSSPSSHTQKVKISFDKGRPKYEIKLD